MSTATIPVQKLTEYRKIYGSLLLDQGATYDQIHDLTGLARNTIAKIKNGKIKTTPGLAEAVKKNEANQLAEIGLMARGITIKRLIEDLSSDEPKLPLSQVLKAQEVAFQQRRTLEGEASVIFDHKSTSEGIDVRRARIEELQAERDVRLSQGDDGVYSAD